MPICPRSEILVWIVGPSLHRELLRVSRIYAVGTERISEIPRNRPPDRHVGADDTVSTLSLTIILRRHEIFSLIDAKSVKLFCESC